MLFSSPLFLFLFLPVFLSAYYLVPGSTRVKNFIALIGSVTFFAWGEPFFVFLLIIGTAIDYKISLLLSPSSDFRAVSKRALLIAAVSVNVIFLIGAKYLDFIVQQVWTPLEPWLRLPDLSAPNIPLVLGISFITFHRISYLVDSFRGRANPPRNFFDCALYIFLFPQLIAGPIIRYHDIGHQINFRQHCAGAFLAGFFRFSVGLFKKLVIADPLGLLADKIFAFDPSGLSQTFAWGGIVAYSLQIYFDFSAYSDMAIGLGRMIGFRFPENFNRPYISRSISEFWRRWHISLSNWMRVYLYIPLGGNQVTAVRIYMNLWIVFIISGIWHGASWNFLVWGAYYGLFLTLERLWAASPFRDLHLPSFASQVVTLFIVMVGWVFFRSPSLEHAFLFLASALGVGGPNSPILPPWGLVFRDREIVTVVIATVIACANVTFSQRRFPAALAEGWSESMTARSLGDMALLFLATLLLLGVSASALVSADYVPFLYFRF